MKMSGPLRGDFFDSHCSIYRATHMHSTEYAMASSLSVGPSDSHMLYCVEKLSK